MSERQFSKNVRGGGNALKTKSLRLSTMYGLAGVKNAADPALHQKLAQGHAGLRDHRVE